MMDPVTRAVSFAREQLDAHGLEQAVVTVSNRMKRGMGAARVLGPHKELILAAWHVKGSPWEEVRDTILHEVAHLIVGPHKGHGREWKACAARIGARPERLASAQKGQPMPRWLGTCDCPDRLFLRYRLSAGARFGHCAKCEAQVQWIDIREAKNARSAA